jgi:hypothetical protein
MSLDTTNNFWEAFAAWNPEPPKPVFYRLYYNEQGIPLLYTMEDLTGNYIEVDRETYLRSPTNCRIVDNKLVILESQQFNKLKPSNVGVSCAVDNICIVVDADKKNIKWSLKNNETS